MIALSLASGQRSAISDQPAISDRLQLLAERSASDQRSIAIAC
jgi:hypothetical protein